MHSWSILTFVTRTCQTLSLYGAKNILARKQPKSVSLTRSKLSHQWRVLHSGTDHSTFSLRITIWHEMISWCFHTYGISGNERKSDCIVALVINSSILPVMMDT